MVSGHEQSHSTNPTGDQLENQIERLVDLGVTTPYGAVAQVLDIDPHRDDSVVRDPRAAEAANNHPHYSRRGGRSYPEPSDSELDPNWQQAGRTPLSEEQVRTNHVAASVIKSMLRARREDPDAAKKQAAHLDEVRARLDAEQSTKLQ